MAADDNMIKKFTTRVRQLILQHQELKKENEDLYTMVDERDKKIAELESLLSEQKRDYESLKLAKMLETTDKDIESAKARISKLIRSINQCITLLGGK